MRNTFSNLREFENLQLDSEKQVLWFDGQPVKLHLKEIELLSALTERPGEVLTKQELLDRVWADSFVEESNLSRHIYRLRKTFGALGVSSGLIETVPRRGYRFTGSITELEPPDLIIERHSRTETTIEEIHQSDPPQDLQLHEIAPKKGRQWRSRLIAAAAAAAVFVFAAGITFFRSGEVPAADSTVIRSVAVLPLTSISGNSSDVALSNGIADTLISRLGQLKELRVVSVPSATSNRSGDGDPANLGRELGVDSVLEGSLQQNYGKIRVTLRLLRSSNGSQIWTGTFDQDNGDIFGLQDTLAAQTARAISNNLSAPEWKPPTTNQNAYQLYLLGRYFLDKRTAADFKNARIEFEKAIAIDPNFALAYTGLADAYALEANINFGEKRIALYERSRREALRALEIDNSLAEAHTSLGWIKRVYDWDWQGAETEFKRALAINPNYVTARQWYALQLTIMGRHDEALEHIEAARQLEPLSRSVLLNYFSVRLHRREYGLLPGIAEQIAKVEQPEERNIRILSIAYLKAGDFARVIQLGEADQGKTNKGFQGSYFLSNLAVAHYKVGNTERADEVMKELKRRSEKSGESAYRLAMAYAELGRNDEAIEMLRKCLAVRDDRMVWLKVDACFDPLRRDARFQEIIAKLRFP